MHYAGLTPLWTLKTGGKGVPGRMNLWRISGTATHILDPWAVVFDPFWPGEDIPSQQLTVMGQSLGTLGYFYRLLPDDTEVPATVYASGYDFYTFTPYCGKFHPYIRAFAGGNSYNLDTDTPKFCVGQQVTFELDWDPYAPGEIVDYRSRWTLPQKFVNEKVVYWSGPPECDNYDINWNLLQNTLSTSCWFVNKPGGTAGVGTVGMWVNLHFFNGQFVSIAADGELTIYRPSVNQPVPYGPFGAGISGGSLSLVNGPMLFDVTINSTYPGVFGLTQLVNMYSETIMIPPDVLAGATTLGNFTLDGVFGGGEYYDGPNPSSQQCQIADAPGQPLILYIGSYNGNWQDYVRFTPNGGIPVTLGRIDWNWSATALETGPFTWTVTSDGVSGPTLHDDDRFPLWNYLGILGF